MTLNKRQLSLSLALVAGQTLLPTATAQALSFKGAEQALKRLQTSVRDVSMHPFGAVPESQTAGFGLFDRGGLSFNDAVKRALRSNLVNPMIEMRSQAMTGFNLASGAESREYRFYVGGVPLCGFEVRAHSLSNKRFAGSMLMLGTVPDIDPYEPVPSSDWPDLELTLERVAADARALDGGLARAQLRLEEKSRCLYVDNGKLLPVWQLTVSANGLPYTALADAYETIKLQPAFFDVEGSAKVYPRNRLDPELETFKLVDLVGDGTLTSTYLKTSPAGKQQANEPTHVFDYPLMDDRFDEAQVYVHTQTHFQFFTALGFQWYGPKPVDIQIHEKPGGQDNNALFIPGSEVSGKLPRIQIGDGSDGILQNLVSDGDVVSHEFGHHVIYKTLTETDGESKVLHEGLADFFVFSRTADPCLGESICPAGSSACVLEGQCLRTAANGVVYNDAVWTQWYNEQGELGHKHGQVVSGMLWDLRSESGVVAEDVTKLVFKAISYFKPTSGIRDLMLALFTADIELFNGKYFTQIQAVGTARGFSEFFADVTAGNPIPALEGTEALPNSGSTTPSTGSKKTKSSSGNPFACGTVAYQTGRTGDLLLVWLLALPVLLLLAPVPAKAVAMRRRRRTPNGR